LSGRRTPVIFFYGLFMDPDLLRANGASPREVEHATVFGFSLRIGRRAALVPDPGSRVEGMIATLTAEEIAQLYADPSLRAYHPMEVLAHLADGRALAAVCYNLTAPPAPDERNDAYATKLRSIARKVGLSAEYIATIK
jgi:hypothetical protein